MTGLTAAFANGRVIVMAAPNGARRMRADHPALPLTPRELAATAGELLDAGVSVLHLHVRDRHGRHTLDPDHYALALQRIRRRTGRELIVQVTTESVGRYTADEQMAVVRKLRPEAVSLSLRELCPDAAAEPAAGAFFAWLQRERIWPQYILHSPADVARFERLRRTGLFADDQPFCLFVLGRYADQRGGGTAELDVWLAAADAGRLPWAVCCFGPREHDAALAALARGGHVRVGFENNLVLANGQTARNNAALVQQFTSAALASPRRPAAASEIRAVLENGMENGTS